MPPESSPESPQLAPEELLKEFHDRLAFWNEHVNFVPPEYVEHELTKGQNELDDIWKRLGNMDEFFLLKGKGYYNIANFDVRDSIETDQEKWEKGFSEVEGILTGTTVAMSAGVAYHQFEGKPGQFYLLFVRPGITLQTEEGKPVYTEMWAVMEPESVELVPCYYAEESFGSYERSPLHENAIGILTTAAKEFEKDVVGDDFTTLNAYQKGDYVDTYIKEVEKASGIVMTKATLHTEKLVLTRPEADGKTRVEVQSTRFEKEWVGRVLGITMLNWESLTELNEGKRFEAHRDYGSLALSIELDKDSSWQALVTHGTVVHIPLTGPQIGLQFVPNE